MYAKDFLLYYVLLVKFHIVFGQSACPGNDPSDRSTWCDYDINTDYYSVVPDTGDTREYWFELGDAILSPDGVPRYTQTINGSIPGPTIYANWGDEVVIHVTNNLSQSNNGTSIHWHGIRQLNTNQNDGVVSITQCPTAPGDTITYKWRATQYGTTWYHSHFSLQAWEGVIGGIVIEGPASANYDEDKGVIVLSDWSHETPDQLAYYAETQGPPLQDNGLINGTNVWGSVGQRFTTQFEPGTSYRLRLINTAIDTHFTFSIDNHTMTVIEADFVPVEPFTVDVLPIAIGKIFYFVIFDPPGFIEANVK
jgi:FtsP/CotA-like multicopper oxidase with cupredoxin domain